MFLTLRRWSIVLWASILPLSASCGSESPKDGGAGMDALVTPHPDAAPSDMGVGARPDAMEPDLGAADSGVVDAEPAESGPSDGAAGDAPPIMDALPADTGTTAADAGTLDAAAGDTAGADAAPDAASADAASPDANEDAAAADASSPDAEADAGFPDAVAPDASQPDAPAPDAPAPDAFSPDAGPPDTGVVDAGPPDLGVPDSGPPDSGACPTNTACPFGAQNGLCKNQFCAACTDPSDDANCSNAYGTAPNTYLCLGGSCTPGNCRTSANCTGRICGITQASFCGNCTSDAQCQNDLSYGASYVCNVSQGTCVAATCPVPDVVCPYNGADFCCPSAPGTNMCIPGNCCVDGDCTTGQRCSNHICTTCTSVTNGVYYVDPLNGNDSAATGAMNCPFRTITHAISFLGNNLAQDATIHLLDTAPANAASGEAFPITVPRHVHVTGDAQMSVVQPATGAIGFTLSAPSSSLSYLDIDGLGVGQIGISVTAGSTLTTTIDHLIVQNCTGDGISVHNAPGQTAGGILVVNGGVQATANGSSTARRSGLAVIDQGRAYVRGVFNAGAADQIAFNGNTADGIFVGANGSLTVTGTAGVGGAGNVVANNNVIAGLWVEQIVPATSTPAHNLIDGLVAFNNGTPTNAANGINIRGGSNVRVRRSYVLNNRGSGINIAREPMGMGFNENVSHIDLGTDAAADPGRNTIQATFGQMNNARAGLCVELSAATRAVVLAAGNIFAGPRDCAQANPGRLNVGAVCANSVDLSSSMSATVNTLNCTQ